jgi:hypothetical protein
VKTVKSKKEEKETQVLCHEIDLIYRIEIHCAFHVKSDSTAHWRKNTNSLSPLLIDREIYHCSLKMFIIEETIAGVNIDFNRYQCNWVNSDKGP